MVLENAARFRGQGVRHDEEAFTPPGHVGNGVWCDEEGWNPSSLRRYASKRCVVSYNTHNFVKTTHQLLGMGIVPIPSPHSFSPAALPSLYRAPCRNVAVRSSIVEVVLALARTTTGPRRGFQFPEALMSLRL